MRERRCLSDLAINSFFRDSSYWGKMDQSHPVDQPPLANTERRTVGHAGGDRLAVLQSLRAIAASLVLFHHVAQTPGPEMTAASASLRQGFGPFGSAGVDLFFVISGFVIAHGISSNRAPRPHRFLAGRAIRIVPLFWLVSAVFAWQLWLAGSSFRLATIANTITLIPLPGQGGFSYPVLYVGWSLAFELVFYLLAGIVLLAPRERRVPLLFAGMCCLSALGLAVKTSDGPLPFFANMIMVEFALGVLAWLIWRRGIGPATAGWLTGIGLLLLVSGVLSFGQAIETDPAHIVSQATSWQRALMWGLPAAMITVGATSFPVDRSTSAGWLGRLGDSSFSLYLVHPCVLFAVGQWSAMAWIGNDLLFMLSLILLSHGAAALLNFCVERPIIRWGKAITHPESSRRDAMSPEACAGSGRRGEA